MSGNIDKATGQCKSGSAVTGTAGRGALLALRRLWLVA
jgi:hypothetical protein